jgi:hypothetical protein
MHGRYQAKEVNEEASYVVFSNLKVLDGCRCRRRDVDASAQLHRVVNIRGASSVKLKN